MSLLMPTRAGVELLALMAKRKGKPVQTGTPGVRLNVMRALERDGGVTETADGWVLTWEAKDWIRYEHHTAHDAIALGQLRAGQTVYRIRAGVLDDSGAVDREHYGRIVYLTERAACADAPEFVVNQEPRYLGWRAFAQVERIVWTDPPPYAEDMHLDSISRDIGYRPRLFLGATRDSPGWGFPCYPHNERAPVLISNRREQRKLRGAERKAAEQIAGAR